MLKTCFLIYFLDSILTGSKIFGIAKGEIKQKENPLVEEF